jgi:hypothetical protein
MYRRSKPYFTMTRVRQTRHAEVANIGIRKLIVELSLTSLYGSPRGFWR